MDEEGELRSVNISSFGQYEPLGENSSGLFVFSVQSLLWDSPSSGQLRMMTKVDFDSIEGLGPGHVTQLELGIQRIPEPDRNHAHGGRSFYFFDLDDNVLFLDSKIYIFNKHTGEELALSTGEFAAISRRIGVPGPLEDYETRDDDATGSFRRFRDLSDIQNPRHQPFVADMVSALQKPDIKWKGPSWNCFVHASLNQRPMSIITARGHHPETIRAGLEILAEAGHIAAKPNFMGIYPVSHDQVRRDLGDTSASGGPRATVSQLKKSAIIASVETAMQLYGANPHHRFGMSDDAPENLELIVDALRILKGRHPQNRFYVIDTHQDRFVKREVGIDSLETQTLDESHQLELF